MQSMAAPENPEFHSPNFDTSQSRSRAHPEHGDEDAVGPEMLLSEVISALTFALDLTEAAVPGHALRSCLLGIRLGAAIGVASKDLVPLYYALLLKDVGCSSNAARMTAMLGGNDLLLKRGARLMDWTRPHQLVPKALRLMWPETMPSASFYGKFKRLISLSQTQMQDARELIALRCERGAEVVTRLELDPAVADAVRHLDEHWDGSGFPDGLSGNAIPRFSNICLLSLQLDAYAAAMGPDKAIRMARSRRGTWFDPDLISAAESLSRSGDLWQYCLPTDAPEITRAAVLDLDPGLRSRITDSHLSRICEVFSSVVDAKSPFTFRHSLAVMAVAQAVAQEMGLPSATSELIRRGALLHDLGKLGVPNSILDKRGALTPLEWRLVRLHPGLSGSILGRVPALRELARITEQHHERLDGSGYPNALTGPALSLPSRLIALADNYAAMAEHRPYRDEMEPGEILGVLSQEAGVKFDARCFEALEATVRRWPEALPTFPEPAEGCTIPTSFAPVWA